VIEFRYHVVSIAAVFLALATGIALGTGPLTGGVDSQAASAAEQDRQDRVLRDQLDQAEHHAAFSDAYAQATSGQLLAGRLEGRSVALILLPGADDDIANGVADAIAAAGGSVTGTLELQPALLDPQNRQVAEGLATQVLERVEDVSSADDASTYELVGASLARGFLTDQPEGAPVDGAAQTVAATYREADYVTTDDDVDRRASLAVVVSADPERLEQGQAELVTTIIRSLDAASGGVVVAGGATSTTDGGYVAAIRDSEVAQEVSTVDLADTVAGQVVTVLALAEQAGGEAGQYGADAPDGAMPQAGQAG
jgi:hypothetical protein